MHQYKNPAPRWAIIGFYTTAIAGEAPETNPGRPSKKVVIIANMKVACKPVIGGTPANRLIATPSGICVNAIESPESISNIFFRKSL